MKPFKRISLLMLLATLTVFVACGDDDSPKPDNEVSIDGEAFAVANAYMDDWGTACYGGGLEVSRDNGCVPTHSRTGLMFTDVELGGEVCWPSDETFYVEMGLFSPGENGLTAGTYDIVNDEPSGDQSENTFGWVYMEWGNLYANDAEGEVEVVANDNNYRFEFELPVIPYDNDRRGDVSEPEAILVTGYFQGEIVETEICD